jgi:phosphopentomutase
MSNSKDSFNRLILIEVMYMKKIIWIVLDSVGMGAMPDAASYGDEGANTLVNVYEKNGGLNLSHLIELGLGNIEGMKALPKADAPYGVRARLAELSHGKDTTTGHWEMVGIYTEIPFPTYPNGFPKEVMEAFEEKIGTKTIGNCVASGTQIIEDLGKEHMETGYPIIYTSADSVFQIAAHEDIIPLERLYEMCEIARELLRGEHEISRVIARPFAGEEGSFARTPNRHDYAITPPKDNLLTYAKEQGIEVVGVGKISDIFAGEGITKSYPTKENSQGVQKTIELIKAPFEGIVFTNLVDFDMKWGHRNDYVNYGKGLEAFDRALPAIIQAMDDETLLFITADHGCDPTTKGTDHTREYVPFLACGKALKENVDLGTRKSFADMGQTIAQYFSLPSLPIGNSFLDEILK